MTAYFINDLYHDTDEVYFRIQINLGIWKMSKPPPHGSGFSTTSRLQLTGVATGSYGLFSNSHCLYYPKKIVLTAGPYELFSFLFENVPFMCFIVKIRSN